MTTGAASSIAAPLRLVAKAPHSEPLLHSVGRPTRVDRGVQKGSLLSRTAVRDGRCTDPALEIRETSRPAAAGRPCARAELWAQSRSPRSRAALRAMALPSFLDTRTDERQPDKVPRKVNRIRGEVPANRDKRICKAAPLSGQIAGASRPASKASAEGSLADTVIATGSGSRKARLRFGRGAMSADDAYAAPCPDLALPLNRRKSQLRSWRKCGRCVRPQAARPANGPLIACCVCGLST